MKVFDFEKAWEELPAKDFWVLPQNIRDLFHDVAILAENLNQKNDLDMPWPSEDLYIEKEENLLSQGSILLRFNEIPNEYLSYSARVIYSYGHWGKPSIYKVGNGAYWKFANYADQVLRQKLNIPKRNIVYSGLRKNIIFDIHQGYLRVCYEDKDSWLWEEIGPATQDRVDRAKKFIDNFDKKSDLSELPSILQNLELEQMPQKEAAYINVSSVYYKDSY